MSDLYPWPGDFKIGNSESTVAVVTLAENLDFEDEKVAIWGPMRTENLGIEKVVANILSNPNIRFLIVCGDEIKGHRSGQTLLSLIKNGIEENGKIIGSEGAVPYIENISKEAIERFRKQVDGVDLVNITSKEKIKDSIMDCLEKDVSCFGDPYTAIQLEERESSSFEADFALHSSLKLSPWGKIESMEEN